MTTPHPAHPPAAHPAPLAIQLYSLRAEAKADFGAVLERLGRIGYAGVEPAGLHGMSPGEFLRRVEAAGMRVCSSHISLPVGDAANQVLDDAEALGARDVVVAFLPPDRFQDRDQIYVTADQLNRASELATHRGMRLGYHNHYWEFSTRIDGRSAWSLLFEQLAPRIFAEVDVYWAQVGGCDPVEVVGELGTRARLLHMKDGPADSPKSAMTAAGGGAIDLSAVAAAAAYAEWHIVELDRCETDMFEAIEQSHRHLVETGLSAGQAS